MVPTTKVSTVSIGTCCLDIVSIIGVERHLSDHIWFDVWPGRP